MTQIPDENTIISYFHRDDELAYTAFTWIVDLHSKRLYTTIRRWINNHEITNDILQEYRVPGLAEGLSVNGRPGLVWLTKQERIERDYAVFGEASFDVTPQITLTGGARWYKFNNTVFGFAGYGRNPAYDAGEDVPPNAFGSTRTGIPQCFTESGLTFGEALEAGVVRRRGVGYGEWLAVPRAAASSPKSGSRRRAARSRSRPAALSSPPPTPRRLPSTPARSDHASPRSGRAASRKRSAQRGEAERSGSS